MPRPINTLIPLGNEGLGRCQPHEHVFVKRGPAAAVNPALCMDDKDKSLEELKRFGAAGGSSVVDAQPIGAGRDAETLAWLSSLSGIAIAASTGFHRPMFYCKNHWIFEDDPEKLFELFCSELSEGMFEDGQTQFPTSRTKHKAGIVKAAIGGDDIAGRGRQLLTAAGRAAATSGVPLLLHTEAGKCAEKAVGLLESCGLSPGRILLCHADRQATDIKKHIDIASLGVYMEYDTIGRFKYHDDDSEIRLILAMIEAGYESRLLLSLDTTAERFMSYGGSIGLTYIIDDFEPALLKAGLSRETLLKLTVENPAAALTAE